MSAIDIQYLHTISHKLDRFKKKSQNLYNFRCPYCGDSQKKKTKARGFVYKAGNTVAAFIAGESGVTVDQADTTNATGNFSELLQGLSSSTTYTFRAYATNAAGTTYGTNNVATTTASVSYTTRYVDGPHNKHIFACFQTPTCLLYTSPSPRDRG